MTEDAAPLETNRSTGVQEKKFGFLLLAFVMGVLCAVPFYFIGRGRGGTQVRVEAVTFGHARYKIVDHYGRTEFEWLPATGASEKK